MSNISLLDMGRIKKRNVREAIISILGKEYPLSIRKIFSKVKKEYNFDVTYQAVFKIIKELVSDKVLEKNVMEYKLNIKWIKELENEIHILKKNYDNEEEKKESMQERTNDFISVTAPKIRDYIGNDKVSLIAISGGGKLFAMALLKYFLKHGVDTTYNEYNRNESENKSIFKKEDVENRKVLLVDSEIYSGATFKIVMEKISRIKKKFSIKDVKFVVDRDTQGLADFSRTE